MDIDAYLARIGINERPRPNIHGLRQLQRAQRMAIAFENFDIALGHGVSVDPDAVFNKLVTHGRGGYCFEQNQLLGRVLSVLGYKTRPLLGRVWVFANGIPGRTHTLQYVEIDQQPWIADAGFGRGYAPPMRLVDQETVTGEDGVKHRLRVDQDHGWMLEQWRDQEWQQQYSFTVDRITEADLEMSNHWTSTSPHSRFVQNQIASIILPKGVASILGRSFATIIEGVTTAQDIDNANKMYDIVHQIFRLNLSKDDVQYIWAF